MPEIEQMKSDLEQFYEDAMEFIEEVKKNDC